MPSTPTPKPGWVFRHGPMNSCTGQANRCTVDRIENGRVIWYVGDGSDRIRDWYSTSLFKFTHAMVSGDYVTYHPPGTFRLTPKGCTCPQ